MKRFKVNTTWEEDEEERRQFYAALSYAERLRYFMKAQKRFNFHDPSVKRFDLKICDSKIPKAPYR